MFLSYTVSLGTVTIYKQQSMNESRSMLEPREIWDTLNFRILTTEWSLELVRGTFTKCAFAIFGSPTHTIIFPWVRCRFIMNTTPENKYIHVCSLVHVLTTGTIGVWGGDTDPQNVYGRAEIHASFGQNIKNSEELCYFRKNFCMCAKITLYKGKCFWFVRKIFLYICEKYDYGIIGKIFWYVREKFCMLAKITGY